MIRMNRKGFPDELKPIAKKGLKERGDKRTVQYNNLTMHPCVVGQPASYHGSD